MEINELEVDQLNAFVLDLTEDVLGCFGHDEQRGGCRPECRVAGRYGSPGPHYVALATNCRVLLA
jgi:hypothetical protein